MRRLALLISLCAFAAAPGAQTLPPLRPPAVPLIVHDPYFNIWSANDQLTEAATKHWTGTDQPLTGILRIDGAPYRFLGGGGRNSRPRP